VLLVSHRRGARTRPDDTRPRLTRSRIQSTRSVRPGRALVERVGSVTPAAAGSKSSGTTLRRSDTGRGSSTARATRAPANSGSRASTRSGSAKTPAAPQSSARTVRARPHTTSVATRTAPGALDGSGADKSRRGPWTSDAPFELGVACSCAPRRVRHARVHRRPRLHVMATRTEISALRGEEADDLRKGGGVLEHEEVAPLVDVEGGTGDP
jgi:hypothetical protein